jgi:hypothetical protein
MRRMILAWLVLLAPACVFLATTGCEQEVKSVQRTETIHESEPQMTSPGTEVVE